MTREHEREERVKLIQSHVDRLAEHFDSVTILCSDAYSGNTGSYKFGAGNYYARLAMAREFIDEDQARTWRSVMNPED